jgi:glycine reductase
VLTNAPPTLAEKEKLALLTAGQLKYVLGADAAIITKEGGGHPQVDVVLNCERCEELGVKVVIVVSEMMTTSRRSDETLIFNSPKADAIISTGCFEPLDLPPVARLIGGPTIPDLPVTLTERLPASTQVIRGATSHLGASWITSREY